eukprot:GHVL01004852.1.p1 GENE.GHVL01004852.1~~GHVL01004852.1.p1  ORF type:complete len:342 (-),score=35.22 GHVL01004852.1:978-2003(-)
MLFQLLLCNITILISFKQGRLSCFKRGLVSSNAKVSFPWEPLIPGKLLRRVICPPVDETISPTEESVVIVHLNVTVCDGPRIICTSIYPGDPIMLEVANQCKGLKLIFLSMKLGEVAEFLVSPKLMGKIDSALVDTHETNSYDTPVNVATKRILKNDVNDVEEEYEEALADKPPEYWNLMTGNFTVSPYSWLNIEVSFVDMRHKNDPSPIEMCLNAFRVCAGVKSSKISESDLRKRAERDMYDPHSELHKTLMKSPEIAKQLEIETAKRRKKEDVDSKKSISRSKEEVLIKQLETRPYNVYGKADKYMWRESKTMIEAIFNIPETACASVSQLCAFNEYLP